MKKGKLLSGILSCATLTSMASFYASAEEAIDNNQITVPEITGTICGDVNLDGTIGLKDAILLNKAIVKSVLLNKNAKKNADCNADDYLNSEDTVSLLRYLVSLTDKLPEIPQDYVKELELFSKIDEIGYTDELFHLSNSKNSSAIITSCAELEAYLTPITQAETVQMYLSKYDDSFFAENILLLNSIYQSCGGGIMYQIDSVSYQGEQLKIEYSDMYEDDHSYPDVVNGLLAQVTIPKEQYYGVNVVWEYTGLRSLGYTCELGEITPSEKFYDFANSTDAAAMINSADELEAYLTTIAEPETVQEYLIKYNQEFFAEKALLIRAFYTASSGDSFEVTGVLRDHGQITVNSVYQYGDTSDTLVMPYLAQVVLDKADMQNASLTWNVYSQNTPQQPDIVPFTYTSSIIESAYSSNTLYNDYVRVYTDVSELKGFLNSFSKQAKDSFDVSALLETYDEGYFAENVLILANVSLSADGSLELVNVKPDDDYVEIEMRKISDGEEMRGQMALIEVPVSCWTNRTPLISIL